MEGGYSDTIMPLVAGWEAGNPLIIPFNKSVLSFIDKNLFYRPILIPY